MNSRDDERRSELEAKQATFVLRLRAEPGRNPIHSLRRLLKYALRTCGLRAVEVREDPRQ
jgi:hypothetical protein